MKKETKRDEGLAQRKQKAERNEENSQAPDMHQVRGGGAVQIGASLRASGNALPRS